MFEVRKNAMALMVTLALAAAVLSAAARAEEKRIAVVDVSYVFGHYDRVKDVQDKLQAQYDPEQKDLQKEEARLKTWKETIEQQVGMGVDIKHNKDLFKEKLAFDQAMFDFQNKYEALLQKVEDRRKEEMKKVLADIRHAIATIGNAEKYDLILRAPDYTKDFDEVKGGAKTKEELAMEKEITAAELVRRFRDNPVLYFASGVDMTQKVTALLNEDFKKTAARP